MPKDQLRCPALRPEVMYGEVCEGLGGTWGPAGWCTPRTPGPRAGFQVHRSPWGCGALALGGEVHPGVQLGTCARHWGVRVLTQGRARVDNRIICSPLLLRTPEPLIMVPWAPTTSPRFFVSSFLAFSPLCLSCFPTPSF